MMPDLSKWGPGTEQKLRRAAVAKQSLAPLVNRFSGIGVRSQRSQASLRARSARHASDEPGSVARHDCARHRPDAARCGARDPSATAGSWRHVDSPRYRGFYVGDSPDSRTHGAERPKGIPGEGQDGRNRARYRNPRAAELFDAAASSFDPASRSSLYRELAYLMLDDMLVVPLWHEDQMTVTSARVHGFSPSAEGHWHSLATTTSD